MVAARIACRIIAGIAAAALAGCAGGVLDPAGPVAAAQRTILFNALAIMLAIVIPTIVAALAFAWWFRAGNGRARYRPDFTYSGQIEAVVWAIPILVILFLGGIIWIGSHELDPYQRLRSEQPPLEVQVVSLDWKWLFILPAQGVASVNGLIVPAGRPVHFSLTSGSVMNAFHVPRLGSMIYTMNGMVTQLNLQADRPGRFQGRSTMFSGDGFPDMQFTVRAVPPAAFDTWVAATRRSGPTLDRAAYDVLARQGAARPATYASTDPALFMAVARQQIAPAAGPERGRGGPGIHPVAPVP